MWEEVREGFNGQGKFWINSGTWNPLGLQGAP